MYHAHWGLVKSPFRSCLDPHSFYESPTHEEALARLHFLVEQRRRLGLLMGPSGSGKSLLLEVFAGQLRRYGCAAANASLLGIGPAEMLGLLAADFGLNLHPAAPISRLWRALADRLAEFRYQQTAAIVLLDNADRAERETIRQVARLVQHDPSPESRLTVVLAGRRGQMSHLGKPLLELAELRIDVEPWEVADTASFLKSSLAQAGCQSPIFDEPAVARLHALTHGIPREVSHLADLALLAGAGAELERIDADVVESVYRELGVVEV
ncbi:MAG: AAA family ATPase [Pirellulales bacterium]|nr:AAA family ATPase [Pirellulales bacterium]